MDNSNPVEDVSPSKIGVWTPKWMFINWFSGFHSACFLGSMLIFGGVKFLKKQHFLLSKWPLPPIFGCETATIHIHFEQLNWKGHVTIHIYTLGKSWKVLCKKNRFALVGRLHSEHVFGAVPNNTTVNTTVNHSMSFEREGWSWQSLLLNMYSPKTIFLNLKILPNGKRNQHLHTTNIQIPS